MVVGMGCADYRLVGSEHVRREAMDGVTLLMGDCLDRMADIEAGSVDLVLTDPPYGTTACKWDSVVPFEPMWEHVWRVLKPNGVAAFTASQPFKSALVMSNPRDFKHEWVWIKNRGSNFANTGREPMKEHEAVLVFSRGGWTYNKQMQERTGGGLSRVAYGFNKVSDSDNYGKFDKPPPPQGRLRVPSSWQKFNVEVGLHPTQKPVALMEYLIRTYSNPSDTVLDFTMGSGTTGVACVNTCRRFIGIERDDRYFEIAQQRILSPSVAEQPAFI
jgi:site-specific DNA-methyltransferase (adenine-specific)